MDVARLIQAEEGLGPPGFRLIRNPRRDFPHSIDKERMRVEMARGEVKIAPQEGIPV